MSVEHVQEGIDPETVEDWLNAKKVIAEALTEATGASPDSADRFAAAVIARLASLTPPLLIARMPLIKDM